MTEPAGESMTGGIQCCGETFTPGDVVSWHLLEVDPEDYADLFDGHRAAEIEFGEEHHGRECGCVAPVAGAHHHGSALPVRSFSRQDVERAAFGARRNRIGAGPRSGWRGGDSSARRIQRLLRGGWADRRAAVRPSFPDR
ncbi:DUF6578 domain-containing protein [Streptomyces aureus]|uniref:DUF6578 domain-containing protein n=1 Tax=Streptomyces aureus TaxID=193461 RepID=UPI0036AFE0DC